MNNTLKTMLVAAAALTAVSAQAQDKATLDLLVKKGVISAEERAKTLEAGYNASVDAQKYVALKEPTTKSFTIGGYFQVDYENFAYSQNVGGVGTSGYRTQSDLIVRRLYLTLNAQLGEGFSGDISYDISGQFPAPAYNLDRAILTKDTSVGAFDLGWKKVNWGVEEVPLSVLFKDGSSSSNLYGVERSNADRYWQENENGSAANGGSSGRRLGLGFHHLGLFYSSHQPATGFAWGAAVTNGASSYYMAQTKGNNNLNYYANALYNLTVDSDHKYSAGLNFGHAAYYNTTTTALQVSNATMVGYNPYLMAKIGNLTLQAQYMSTKVNGSVDGTLNAAGFRGDHTPTGQTLIASYYFTPNWEGVLRFDKLSTDGRGVAISDVVRNFGAVDGPDGAGISAATFDSCDSYYVGVNYYFSLMAGSKEYAGKNAKIMVGYQNDKFRNVLTSTGATPSSSASVHELRVCAQLAW
jgi:hypothetical protein